MTSIKTLSPASQDNIPDKMKIKLVIIDTFENSNKCSNIKYFYNKNHIDRFTYSPQSSSKLIETDFTLAKQIQE